MTASSIQGGALLDLALDHPKLKLLQQIFRLRKSKTKVVRNACLRAHPGSVAKALMIGCNRYPQVCSAPLGSLP